MTTYYGNSWQGATSTQPTLVTTFKRARKPTLTIYAGSVHRVDDLIYDKDVDVDLIFDLTGTQKPLITGYGITDSMRKLLVKEAAIISIDWPDYSTPGLPKAWWDRVIHLLKTEKDIKTVYVGCMGGKGRTGTFLAIILSLLNLVPKDECPVEYVREVYSIHAVESQSQMTYIEHITGLKVTTKYVAPIPQVKPAMNGHVAPKVGGTTQHFGVNSNFIPYKVGEVLDTLITDSERLEAKNKATVWQFADYQNWVSKVESLVKVDFFTELKKVGLLSAFCEWHDNRAKLALQMKSAMQGLIPQSTNLDKLNTQPNVSKTEVIDYSGAELIPWNEEFAWDENDQLDPVGNNEPIEFTPRKADQKLLPF